MKPGNSNEQNFSLNNGENYRKIFTCDMNVIAQKYMDLTIEYFKYILENMKTAKKYFSTFIIIRGLDTITNVFLHLLHSTKNIDLTYFHCQKSFYFYVEFIGQITDDEKSFLQLTSRDATTYVYKKTIFDINIEFKKINKNETSEFKQQLAFITSQIYVNQMCLLKIIKTENCEISMIEDLYKIMSQIISISIENKPFMNKIENIVDKLYNEIHNTKLFFEMNYLLIKKLIKNKDLINNVEKNLNSENFNEKINENSDKFISWVISC
jgi:hypothetical protein